MSEESIIDKLKEKLNRTLRAKAVLAERSKMLAQQVEDFRKREDQTEHVVGELLDRQRELNFMLHRANSVLHRIQEANAVLSTEFTELVKELPAPSSPDWEERVNKINELFKKTGSLADEIQDDVFGEGAAILTEKSTPAAEQPAQEPVVPVVNAETEAEPVQEPEAEVEESIPAAVFSAGTAFEPEVTEEEIEGPVVVEAQFTDPDPVNPNVRKRLDSLFGQAEAKPKNQQESETEADAAETEANPGFMSGIWRKIFARNRKNGKEDPVAEPEPESAEDVQPEPVEVKLYADDQPEQPAELNLSNLLDDTANELEQIQMEFIPAEIDEPQSEPAATDKDTKKSIPFWARWMKRIEAERHRRTLLAIDRVTGKRTRRKNRRRNQARVMRGSKDFHSMMRQSICIMRIYRYEACTI